MLLAKKNFSLEKREVKKGKKEDKCSLNAMRMGCNMRTWLTEEVVAQHTAQGVRVQHHLHGGWVKIGVCLRLGHQVLQIGGVEAFGWAI